MPKREFLALRDFQSLAGRYRIVTMTTVEENRRRNLRTLAGELGSNVKLAEVTGYSEAMISQWIHGAPDSRTGKKRGMRPETCRHIEAKTGKPEGWMDADHAREREPVIAITNPALQLAVEFDALPDVLDWTWPNGRHGTKTDVRAELTAIIQARWHNPPAPAEAKAPAAESTPSPAPVPKKQPGKARTRPKVRSGGRPT